MLQVIISSSCNKILFLQGHGNIRNKMTESLNKANINILFQITFCVSSVILLGILGSKINFNVIRLYSELHF